MEKLKVLTVVLGMMCALCLVGCKNAAEDSGSGDSGGSTPTPTGVQITSESDLKAFLKGTETKGVITQGFTLTNGAALYNNGVAKTIDFWGKTVDFGQNGLSVGPSCDLTLCNSSTTAATINGSFVTKGVAVLSLIENYQGTLSIKDGINLVFTGDSTDVVEVLDNSGGTINELNANITVSNSSKSTSNLTCAIYSTGSIKKITGGKYEAINYCGDVRGINAGEAVGAITAGVEFNATTTGSGVAKNFILNPPSGGYPGVTFKPGLND